MLNNLPLKILFVNYLFMSLVELLINPDLAISKERLYQDYISWMWILIGEETKDGQ
jgi:hypothetical protein